MHELTFTRHNPHIDPMLGIWDWQIPVYLFLGGLVAGIMIISGYFLLSGRDKASKTSCFHLPLLSLALISVGMFALFLDLEHKWYVWQLYTTFQPTSPMSWGAWILLLVYPILIGTVLMNVHDHFPKSIRKLFPILDTLSAKLSSPASIRWLAVGNMLIGAALGIYTGILLSAFGARPLWNSAMLWVLFLVSGLSSAAALVHMIASLKSERELLAKADNGFLIFELIVLGLYLIGLLSSTQAHQAAAHLLLNGSFAAPFWVLVVGIGIVIPLIIQLLAVNHKVNHTAIAPVTVILGGLFLRFIIVSAGQQSSWINTIHNHVNLFH